MYSPILYMYVCIYKTFYAEKCFSNKKVNAPKISEKFASN